jgi:CHAT domain-containing protein
VDDAAAVETKLKSLVDEQERFLSNIRSAKTVHANSTQPRTLRSQEIQRLLDNDTLLLEYAVNEERVYLWAVTRDSISPYSLAKRAEIERAAETVRGMLTAYEPPKPGESDLQYLARMTAAAGQYQQAALELSRMVLAPIASQLGKKRLVIVADGALQYIPFEALPAPVAIAANAHPTENASGHPPLLSQHEVVYQPSASTLAMLRAAPRHTATKTVAVLADPVFDSNDRRVRAHARGKHDAAQKDALPRELSRSLRDVGDVGAEFKLERLEYTAKEANAIAASAPPGMWMKAVSFKASRATATGGSLKQFSIVHFATHGIVNDKHPELSGIVLSMVDETGQPVDGYLGLGDIYNLDLPVDLVVLSGCRTGIGKQVRGEGLISLTRGFMYAGAPRVVASLWKVDDEATSELMSRFYRLMLRLKLPAAAALRRAKMEMRERPEWRNPYYWAGFVLQGDWQ